jgi:hypothetical protein
MNQSESPDSSIKSEAKLRYGPEFLRLIESPEFRSHFESEAWPVATKRFEPQGALNLKTAVEPRMDPDGPGSQTAGSSERFVVGPHLV